MRMFKKQYLAVDIGNRNIKIAYGAAGKEKIVITEYDIIDTPSNAIKDGKIINTRILVDAIVEALKKNRIKAGHLVLNITGTSVITRDIMLPKSSDQEIERMLEFEAQQYFPVDLENYVVDFKVLEDVTTPEGVQNRVLLVAVPQKQVEEYMKLPGLLKMDLTAIDLPANCMSKFLFHAASSEAKAEAEDVIKEFAVLDIGSETTGVCIFYGDKLKFNRILLNGSSDIDRLISDQYDIDYRQAEGRKVMNAIVVNDEEESAEEPETLALNNVIKPAINNLISDINRFFEFYNSRNAGNRIQRIYICGGGGKLKGLDKYIGSYFNMPVEQLKIPPNVVYKGKKKQESFRWDFVTLINAIGGLVR